ncbi:MAG: hypothetical protein ACYS1A_02520 [Planctomycetota bacterium]|jgi:hypothetical protein
MFKPYKEIERTDEFTVYEFKTIYLWLLYLILAIIAMGYLADIMVLAIVGLISMFLYFAVVSTQYMSLNRKIKKATKEGAVEISGSKWSFQKPVRVKIPNKFT